MRNLVALSMSVLVGGCIPWPHSERAVPAISGIVTFAGVPVSGATVFVHRNLPLNADSCPDSPHHVKTNEAGRFAVDSVDELHFFVVIGDPISTWAICINSGGATYVGWRNSELGYARERADLNCELTEATEGGRGRGVCRQVGA
jgi:hypothetical protein